MDFDKIHSNIDFGGEVEAYCAMSQQLEPLCRKKRVEGDGEKGTVINLYARKVAEKLGKKVFFI